ncbi:MAG: S8 family serine peptidase, partial [Bacteroidetes bacterium]|nr:S8 family serine peptidase [Bacteroidota bacterium]
MNRNLLFIISLVFITSYTVVLAGNDYSLLLKTYKGTPDANFEQVLTKGVIQGQYFLGYTHKIIQFNDIPSNGQKQIIKDIGVILLDYIPYYAYIAAIPAGFDPALLSNSNVRSIIDIKAVYKTAPSLLDTELPVWALQPNDQIALHVKPFKDQTKADLINAMQYEGYTVTDERHNQRSIKVNVPIKDILRLASLPFVQYIEPTTPPPTHDDQPGRSLHRSNAINTDNPLGLKFDGSGVTVGIADDGAIGPHIDFTGRLTNVVGSFGGSHGDMTGGICAGAGNLNPRMKGMATGADLRMYTIFQYPQINNAVTYLNNDGVVITSTSYSQGFGGTYTTDSEDIDEQIYDNPVLIHIFSAGNSGNSDHGYGAGPGWGNITGGYKASKNVVACGNLDNKDDLENSSSKGPADDGRIKPDLCANGYQQISTDPGNTYAAGGGTSAASPGVAGCFVQLYHAFKDLNAGVNPESGLIKACFLNTAEDLGNPGPDFKHGWGRVNAYKAYKILDNGTYLEATISQNDNNSHSITVPSGTMQLRAMVYWTDVEGSAIASKALVNDINMVVVTPANDSIEPWVLNPTPNATILNLDATRGTDDL